MGKYSRDYKKRAVAYKKEGHTFAELKEAFLITPQTYYEWEKSIANGTIDTVIKYERSRKINKEQLKQAVEERPDAYLSELAAMFDCTPPAVFYALEKLGITLKKRRSHIPKNAK